MTIAIQLAMARAKLVTRQCVQRAAAILSGAGMALQEALAWVRIWRCAYRLNRPAPLVSQWPRESVLCVGGRRIA